MLSMCALISTFRGMAQEAFSVHVHERARLALGNA